VRFSIRHATRFSYDRPVFLEPHTLRLQPRSAPAQRLVGFRLEVSPSPAGLSPCLELEGNAATRLWFEGEHQGFYGPQVGCGDGKGAGQRVGGQGQTVLAVEVEKDHGEVALEIGLLVDGLEGVAPPDVLEDGRAGVVGDVEDLPWLLSLLVGVEVEGVGRQGAQGGDGAGLGVAEEVIREQAGRLLHVVGDGQAVHRHPGWLQDAAEAGQPGFQTAVAHLLDGAEGPFEFEAAFCRFLKDGPAIGLAAQVLAGPDVEEGGQGLEGAGLGVGGVKYDYRDAGGPGALDVGADGLRVGATDPQPVHLAGDGVVEEIGHVGDGEGGITQPLHLHPVAGGGVLHAADDHIPEGIARTAVGDKGEAVAGQGRGTGQGEQRPAVQEGFAHWSHRGGVPEVGVVYL